MATFKLGKGADILDMGTDGTVSQGGQVIGNWRTTADNNIQVKNHDGVSKVVPVTWGFTGNQLAVYDGSTKVFDFQADANTRVGFELNNGVLRFTPDRLAGFAFDLRCDFALQTNHDLEIVIGTRKSKLTGFIEDADRQNRFLYIFKDAVHPLLMQRLQFAGKWEAPATGEAALRFIYTDKDGKEQVFEMPGNLTINRSTNQLSYEYTKGGKKSFQFDGVFSVTPDFQLVYSIGRTQNSSGGVVTTESVISIGAKFNNSKFSGDLEFEVKKTDGTTTTLTLAGTFAGVLSPNLKVVAGFVFRQVRASGQTTQTMFGFKGQLKYKDSATVTWEFSTTNTATKSIALKVGTDIRLSSGVAFTAQTVFENTGGQKTVTLLLGFSF